MITAHRLVDNSDISNDHLWHGKWPEVQMVSFDIDRPQLDTRKNWVAESAVAVRAG